MFYITRALRRRDEARTAYLAADDAWSAEIEREYGPVTSSQRFALATSTPRLARLHRAMVSAAATYQAALGDVFALQTKTQNAA